MKLDNIYIWNNKHKIVIYSVFEDKNYTIKNIYNFLNKNLGTKKKILLIKNTYSIPDSNAINEINLNFSLGCIFKNDINLLKNSLNALIINYSNISNSLFDNMSVNQLDIISKETNDNLNIIELEKLVKSNVMSNDIKFKYQKYIDELENYYNKKKGFLQKELININKQIDSLSKGKLDNKYCFFTNLDKLEKNIEKSRKKIRIFKRKYFFRGKIIESRKVNKSKLIEQKIEEMESIVIEKQKKKRNRM